MFFYYLLSIFYFRKFLLTDYFIYFFYYYSNYISFFFFFLFFFNNLLLILYYFRAVTYVLVRKFQMIDNQSTAQVFNNSICSSYPSSSVLSDTSLCNTSQSFNKFLFFYCDGLARDLAQPVLDTFGDNYDVLR